MELHTHQTLPVHMPPVFNPPQFAPHNFSPSPVSQLYDRDIYAWATENARLLKERRFDELDLTNLIDEVQDMAKSEQRGLHSFFKLLVMYLLKWQFQPSKRTTSWELSIANARDSIADLVKESPSLRPKLEAVCATVYPAARKHALIQTKLSVKKIPETSPFTFEQVLSEDWLPA